MCSQDHHRLAARNTAPNRTTHLIEKGRGVLLLRVVDEWGVVVSETAPLFSDAVALAKARELFPEHLPWGGMPVDGG